jgi:hypothetical protein
LGPLVLLQQAVARMEIVARTLHARHGRPKA